MSGWVRGRSLLRAASGFAPGHHLFRLLGTLSFRMVAAHWIANRACYGAYAVSTACYWLLLFPSRYAHRCFFVPDGFAQHTDTATLLARLRPVTGLGPWLVISHGIGTRWWELSGATGKFGSQSIWLQYGTLAVSYEVHLGPAVVSVLVTPAAFLLLARLPI